MAENDVKTIMAVGAHHDDNELVAGTLALHRNAGWRVVSVVMTNGVWINGKCSEDHIPIREAESKTAAKLLGMDTEFMRFSEGVFRSNIESSLALLQIIRTYAPDVLITHDPHDYHLDHIETSRCAFDAVSMAWNASALTDVPPCQSPKLYYADTWFVPFQPDEYVDITETISLKLAMMRCHTSQLPEQPADGDMMDLTERQSLTRGVESGVKFAEAFRFVPRLASVRLSELLS
jgi:LmbE family N-acetylglucosaminyl deacetylase